MTPQDVVRWKWVNGLCKLDSLTEEPYLKEACVKMVIRDVSWAPSESVEGKLFAGEQLEEMEGFL